MKFSDDKTTQEILTKSESKEFGLLNPAITAIEELLTEKQHEEATISLLKKTMSSNVGFKAQVDYEGGSKIFYVKYNSHTNPESDSSTKSINSNTILDFLVYRTLEKMGFGAKSHFFCFEHGKDGSKLIAIMTQDMTREKSGGTKKQYYLALEDEFRNLLKITKKESRQRYDIMSIASAITFQILDLYDLNITNVGNIFTINGDDSEIKKAKPKTIDFLVNYEARRTPLPISIETFKKSPAPSPGLYLNCAIDKESMTEENFEEAKKIVFGGRFTDGGKKRMSIDEAFDESMREAMDFLEENGLAQKELIDFARNYYEKTKRRIHDAKSFEKPQDPAKSTEPKGFLSAQKNDGQELQ